MLAVGGGVGGGVVLRWTDADAAWRRAALPPGSGALWWTWLGPDGDAVAVGAGATVLRRVAGTWLADDVDALVDPFVTLYGAWGAAADDVWVVGGMATPGTSPGVILHWDGVAWRRSAEADGPLYKVWGAAADDVWAVGDDGVIMHGDGATWTAVETGTTARLVAVMGRAADEVYAVGGDADGVVLRYDGARWAAVATTPEPLAAVWTAPGAALVVGGSEGTLVRLGAAGAAPLDLALRTEAALAWDVDVHALAGGGGRVVAVGASLVGVGADGARGGLAVHGAPLGGALIPLDAGVDAASIDADPGAPDAGVDAAGADANGPTEGQACATSPPDGGDACADGLTCYLVDPPVDLVCTHACATVDACAAFGPGACCRVPHPQTTDVVCLPAAYCGAP